MDVVLITDVLLLGAVDLRNNDFGVLVLCGELAISGFHTLAVAAPVKIEPESQTRAQRKARTSGSLS